MAKATIYVKSILPIAFIFLLLHQTLISAQNGNIKGRVLDKSTEQTLAGANVVIKGTSLGAATDLDGGFIIRNVPAGNHSVKISYIGYNSVTVDINVTANKTLQQDFYLEPTALQGKTVVITGQAEGQLSAINQQLTSNTIANVVSAARIKELPDVNAAESIGRLPGISIERYGGEATKVSIRGLEPKYNTVTVNGVRVPATGGDDRSVDLSLISSNMLDGITVKKANTPDMDADALGGTVDLRLKEAPEGFKFSGTAQGGYNKLQDYYGNYNFTGSLSDRFFKSSLGIIANFNLDNYDRSADKFQGNYEQIGSGNAATFKPNDIRLRDESVKRGRTGASLLLDYRIPSGKITANSFYNRLKSDNFFRNNYMRVHDNRHEYELEERNGTTSIFTGALGMEQDFNWIKYDFAVSRTSSLADNPNDYTWNFVQENAAFDTKGVLPEMDPHLVPALQTIDTAMTGYRSAYIYSTQRKENESAIQFNTQVPFNIGQDFKGYFKFGGKFRWLDRNNNQEQWGRDNIQYGGQGYNSVVAPTLRYLSSHYPNDWNWKNDSTLAKLNAVFPVSRFLSNETSPRFLNGEYDFGFMINQSYLREFTEALKATAVDNPNNWLYYAMGSMGRDYDGIERYQAGYVMAEFSYKDFVTIIPGVRYEKDYTKYNGQRFREVESAGIQLPPSDFQDLTNVRQSEFWLPMVHLIINPFDWLKIRLAETQTLTRPDYIQYAPITSIDRYSSLITANNAGLKPAKSTNFDASVQVFENYTGFFTVSGFYKKIDNLIFQTGYFLRAGIPILAGLNVPSNWLASASPYLLTYVNNPHPAYYRGFEIEWQTHFWYLPSILQGIVLNVNYTRIFSEVDKEIYVNHSRTTGLPPRQKTENWVVDSVRTARMPLQPGHIFNITLGYDYKGFSTRLSYLYQTDKITSVGTYESLDQVTEPYARWDLTFQQKLNWGIQLFANLTNLNARMDRSFRGRNDINEAYAEHYGFTMDFGIRFNL